MDTQNNANELLSAFIITYNDDQENAEATQQALDELQVAFHLQSQENETLKQQIEQQDSDLHEMSKGLKDVDKIARSVTARKNENNLLKAQLNSVQEQLTSINSVNIKKLKSQVERVKTKSDEKDKKITSLTTELSNTRHKLTAANKDNVDCKKIVEAMRIEQDNKKPQGLYHDGDHHLVIWHQKNEMQRNDGSTFNGTNLLYLHQSGRGGFITFDPQTDESKLCPAPKAGLRPSKDALDFAQNWLYKVNKIQHGDIEDADRLPIDYN